MERFTRLAIGVVGGTLEPDRKREGVFRLSVPREFVRQHHLDDESYVRSFRIAFERQIARDADAEFFAPGRPLLEALCTRFLEKSKPIKAALVDERGRDGSFWLFRAKVQDGHGQPVIERLLALFYDRRTAEVNEVDPRMIWELESTPHEWKLPQEFVESIDDAEDAVRRRVTIRLEHLRDEAQKRRERECQIKKDWLERSFNSLISESNAKLFDYHRRAERGEDMRIVIQKEEENLKALVREKEERLGALDKGRMLTLLEPEIEAVAIVLPKQVIGAEATPPTEGLKRRVEEVGMREAMRYERENGREPQDVSNEFRGYDIVSAGGGETRYIEVKAFAETGPVELTPHEWQMANRLGDAYWLYVVENALTRPKLNPIPNPAKNLKPKEVWGVIKIVVRNWKSSDEKQNSDSTKGGNPA